MKKNIFIMLSLILNVALVGSYVHLTNSVKSKEMKNDAELRDLKLKAVHYGEKVALAPDQDPDIVANIKGSIEPEALPATLPSGAKTIAKMLTAAKDPNTADTVTQCIEAQQQRRFGMLFSQLNLPQEKLAELKTILAKHFIDSMQLVQTSHSEGVPIDMNLVNQSEEQLKTQLEQLLNPNQTYIVEDAVQHPSAWGQLSNYSSMLSLSGAQNLNDEQLLATLDALGTTLPKIPVNVSTDKFNALLTKREEHNAAILASLSQVLTSDQSAVLAKQLSNNIAQVKLNFILAH